MKESEQCPAWDTRRNDSDFRRAENFLKSAHVSIKVSRRNVETLKNP